MPFQRLSTTEGYQSVLDKYDTWMFDCDGVIWNGDTLVDGALEVLALLRTHKKRVLFVTNNATKSRKKYKGKFDQLGVEAHVDEIYGSAYASAVYLSSVVKLPKTQQIYVIGMSGIEDELHEEGYQTLGGTNPEDCTLTSFSLSPASPAFASLPDPSKVGAVVCGLDLQINYTKLCKAFHILRTNPECLFVTTNEDSTFPTADGILPGAGSLSAPLKFALGPEGRGKAMCTGKPSKVMLDCIKAKVNFDPARTIMVGDRLNTDILFGQSGGLATLLVLTGITQESELTGPTPSPIVSDYVTASLGDFRRILPATATAAAVVA